VKINVYDFDDTIYNGDSSFHFFLYAIKKFKVSILNLLKIFFNALLYLLKLKTTKEFKEVVFSFLTNIDDIDSFVDTFWEKHKKNIKKEFLEIIKNNKNNYIISASPEFLLKNIAKELKCELIATPMNKKTALIEGANCNKEEKVKRLNNLLKDYQIIEFYSDSNNDLPLARLAKRAYKVKKYNIRKWDF
jgi:HAD phosphoserine phosphatase-like hydrolase, family IB